MGMSWWRITAMVWTGVMVVILFGVLPWGLYELHHHGTQTHVQAWFAAGVFVCLAVPMSVWDVAQHFRHYHNPVLQKHIIRVLWMVPIYAVTSWLGLRFYGAAIYLDTVRECYEAYVIYNFFNYLLVYLRLNNDNFDLELTRRPPQKLLFPLCKLKPWRMGGSFLGKCTHGVTSYILVRPLVTMIALACETFDAYGEGEIRGDKAYAYLAFITNCSQAWAMYCLVLFYTAFKKDLKEIKPFGKFLTIKAVVFFSFWQSIVISILVKANVITTKSTWTHYNSHSVAAGLQDFLICIEMFIAALVHHKVFSYREHLPQNDPELRQPLGFADSLRALFDVSDVHSNVVDHIQTVGSLARGQHRATSERTGLLNSDGAPQGEGVHYGTSDGLSAPASPSPASNV
eukprot:m.52223 g.52223  ORF g.52223 m.52223 type:complete len:400 (+) comp6676_c0_seq2:229-1428(+)